MSKNVVIIGAGGHAKVIADIILCSGDNLIGFLDDEGSKQDQRIYKDYEVVGRISDYKKYKDSNFVVAIGDNHVRAEVAKKLDVSWYTAIHPKAIICDTAKVGVGTVVMAGAIVNADTAIGKHCIINTAATIDHDNKIGDFVHISPGAHLAGTVEVGKFSWIGIGGVVINNVEIIGNVNLGAGAVVVKNIEESGTYVGIPARRLK